MDSDYRLGRFEPQSAQRQLVADGRPVGLGQRAFDVLHALVQRRERLVTENELLDIVWPGVVVEENNLQVQISTLRARRSRPGPTCRRGWRCCTAAMRTWGRWARWSTRTAW